MRNDTKCGKWGGLGNYRSLNVTGNSAIRLGSCVWAD